MKNKIPTPDIRIDEQLIANNFLPKAAILVTFAAGLLVFAYTVKFGGTSSNDQEIWGQFGDFLGGILNPLISFLTLMVATKVWSVQREALDVQKQELVETRKVLQAQVSLSRITVADQTLQSFFQAIASCTQAISISVTSSSTNLTVIRYGDDAITDSLDQFSSDGMWEIGFSDLPENVKRYAEATLNNWMPLMNSIEQTLAYVNENFDESGSATRFELMRFHLSLAKLHALCFFIRLNKDDKLHEVTRAANLLKNYPNGPIKDWFYYGEPNTQFELFKSC